MKKILLLAMVFFLPFSMFACSKEKNITIDEEQLVKNILKDDETPMLQAADEETVKNTFGLNPDDYESQYTEFSMVNVSATNVSVVKAKKDKVEVVKKALEKRRDEVKSMFDQYRIEPAYTTSQNGEVIVKGDYVILLIVENKEEALKEIDKAFKQ